MSAELEIREAVEGDVAQIAALYLAVYGEEYPFREFYDTEWIKRGVFDRDILWLVAEEEGALIGSIAVMLNAGDADDLVGELGRLVVHPSARGKQLATKLVARVTEEAEQLCDFIFGEARTAHVGSQLIMGRERYGFVGIEPLAYQINGFESVVFLCHLTDNARLLRRGKPAVIPEAYELAQAALRAVALEADAQVVRDPAPYPRPFDVQMRVSPVSTRQAYRLVRLGRDCFLNPEVFGAFRLEHGHLKLKQHDARYLALSRGEGDSAVALGGLGYTWDEVERKASIFELVAATDEARGALLELGLRHIEEEHAPRYLSVDVNAHATRMQRSLTLLGFAPVVYAPSMVYVMGERFDVIRMVKLRQEPALEHWKLLDEVVPLARRVQQNVERTTRGYLVDEVVRGIALFDGLTDVQIGALSRLCASRTFEAGEVLFECGAEDQALFLVERGAVDLFLDGEEEPFSTIQAGSFFGEMALIEALPRSAGAVCAEVSSLLVLTPACFDEFVRQHPAGGVVVLRNIAQALSRRLRRMNTLL